MPNSTVVALGALAVLCSACSSSPPLPTGASPAPSAAQATASTSGAPSTTAPVQDDVPQAPGGTSAAQTKPLLATRQCERWVAAVEALPGRPSFTTPHGVEMPPRSTPKVAARCIPNGEGYWYVALLPGYQPDASNQYHEDHKLTAGWRPAAASPDIPDDEFRLAPHFGPRGYFHAKSVQLQSAEVVDLDQLGRDDLVVGLGDYSVIFRSEGDSAMPWYPGNGASDEPAIEIIRSVEVQDGRVAAILGTTAVNWCDDGGKPWSPPPIVVVPGATPGKFVLDRPASEKALRTLCGNQVSSKLFYPSSRERTQTAIYCAMALGAPMSAVDAAMEKVIQRAGCESVGEAVEKFAAMWLYRG